MEADLRMPPETLDLLLDKLAVRRCPPRWQDLYGPVRARYLREGCPLVDEDHLRRLNETYGMFTDPFPRILAGAALLRSQPDLACFLLLMQAAMADRSAFRAELAELDLPEAPQGADSLGHNLLPLFLLPPAVPATVAAWQARGIPGDIQRRSLQSFEGSLRMHIRRYKRFGFSLGDLSWCLGYIDGRLLRIGRFNIEIKPRFGGHVQVFRHRDGRLCTLVDQQTLHRSGFALGSPGLTDEDGSYEAAVRWQDGAWQGYPVLGEGRAAREEVSLAQDDWHLVLTADDPVLGEHIPADESLAPAVCEQSYRDAVRLVDACFPDFPYKAFSCHSWMMDPQLRLLLRPDANLVAFQSKYTVFPSKSSGKAVFRFVFEMPDSSPEDWPETTSLERALKKHYLSGHFIYEPGGFFFPSAIRPD